MVIYFGVTLVLSEVVHREPGALEDSSRIHKFLGKPYEDFQLWMARAEAALQNKEVLHALVHDPVGETALQNLSAEVTLATA